MRDGWSGAGGRWRLLLDGAHAGSRNMGLDSALLESRAGGEGRPTLRLYWWSRPTLSLGHFQDLGDVDLGVCVEAGVDVVRRPTGGRAVLHDHEVTYAIVAGNADGLPRGVAACYRVLCAAVVAAYRRLGVKADLTSRARGGRSAACYLHATSADLSLGTAKLSGAAQVWRGAACLQHGSLVIARDTVLEARVLGLGADGAAALRKGTASIADVLDRPVEREQVADAVTAALAETLGVRLEEGCPTARERERAEELAREAAVLSQGRIVAPEPSTSR